MSTLYALFVSEYSNGIHGKTGWVEIDHSSGSYFCSHFAPHIYTSRDRAEKDQMAIQRMYKIDVKLCILQPQEIA